MRIIIPKRRQQIWSYWSSSKPNSFKQSESYTVLETVWQFIWSAYIYKYHFRTEARISSVWWYREYILNCIRATGRQSFRFWCCFHYLHCFEKWINA